MQIVKKSIKTPRLWSDCPSLRVPFSPMPRICSFRYPILPAVSSKLTEESMTLAINKGKQLSTCDELHSCMRASNCGLSFVLLPILLVSASSTYPSAFFSVGLLRV